MTSYGSEKSLTLPGATTARIEFVGDDGKTQVLKESLKQAGEIIDASVMSRRALCAFYAAQIQDAKQQGRAALAAPQSRR